MENVKAMFCIILILLNIIWLKKIKYRKRVIFFNFSLDVVLEK